MAQFLTLLSQRLRREEQLQSSTGEESLRLPRGGPDGVPGFPSSHLLCKRQQQLTHRTDPSPLPFDSPVTTRSVYALPRPQGVLDSLTLSSSPQHRLHTMWIWNYFWDVLAQFGLVNKVRPRAKADCLDSAR